MAEPVTEDAGPDHAPPPLPPGWIAQWDAKSRKYYFVQISTGESTWEVPTMAASNIPTPGATPAQGNPFEKPGESTRGIDGQEGERGLGSDLMSSFMHTGKNSGQQQSGFGGLAQSFLGGSSHGSSGGQQTSGLGGLAASFLGGGSSHSSGQQQQQQGQYGGSSSGGHSSSGGLGQLVSLYNALCSYSALGSMASSFLGGHGKPSQGSNPYGYSTNGASGGTYTGTAPPASYQPASSHSSTPSGFTPHSGSYNPPGYQSGATSGATSGQYGTPSQHQEYGQQQSQYGGQQQSHYGGQQQSQYGQQSSQYGQQLSHSSPPGSGYGTPQAHQSQSHSSYGGQDQGGYGGQQSYPPPPPMGSHSQHQQSFGSQGGYGTPQSHQGALQGQYGQQPGGYASQSYSQPPHDPHQHNQQYQAYPGGQQHQQHQGGYGQQGSYGGDGGYGEQQYGAPPANPGWQ